MKRIRIIILCTLMGCSLNSFCDTQRLSGVVFDATSNKELPFAHIISGDVVVTTNADGVFSINVDTDQDFVEIQVKYLGYNSELIKVDHSDYEQQLSIGLNPSTQMLEDVVVKTAEKVILDVNRFRQINYEYSDMVLAAYYKESLATNQNKAYLAEGSFDIYLPTIYSSQEVAIDVKKTRKKTFINLDTAKMLFVTGHASDMINGSMRRSHSFLDIKEMKNYYYWKEDISQYDGQEVYIIGFEPATKKGKAKGKLYINTSSNALIKAEYFPMIDRQHFWSQVKWVEEYVQVNNTWLLKQVTYQGFWTSKGIDYVFESLMDITVFDSVDTKPVMVNTINDRAVFFNSADEFNNDFWGQDNYLELSIEELSTFSYVSESF